MNKVDSKRLLDFGILKPLSDKEKSIAKQKALQDFILELSNMSSEKLLDLYDAQDKDIFDKNNSDKIRLIREEIVERMNE